MAKTHRIERIEVKEGDEIILVRNNDSSLVVFVDSDGIFSVLGDGPRLKPNSGYWRCKGRITDYDWGSAEIRVFEEKPSCLNRVLEKLHR